MPFTKYFCRNGYESIIGTIETIIVDRRREFPVTLLMLVLENARIKPCDRIRSSASPWLIILTSTYGSVCSFEFWIYR